MCEPIAYHLILSKQKEIGGRFYFTRAFTNHALRIIDLGYQIQRHRKQWIRDTIIHSNSYTEILAHLFVADEIHVPQHFFDIGLLADEKYFQFFLKIGHGERYWKCMTYLPFELSNSEFYHFTHDENTHPQSIWTGVYYATLTNVTEDRASYLWILPYLDDFPIAQTKERQDLLHFLVNNFPIKCERFFIVLNHLKYFFANREYWLWQLKELDLKDVSNTDIYFRLVENLFAHYPLQEKTVVIFDLKKER